MVDSHHRWRALVRPDRQPIRAELPPVGGDSTTAVIRLYDPIDSWGEWWGISAKEMAQVLDGLPDTITTIDLRVNSPGGEVFEGIAVLNLLRNHPARVVATVEGVAASAASFVSAGCDELVMARNSELMCHDAWGLCVGNAADMAKMAEDLDRISDNIASIYADKAGGTVADWRELMAAETWFSAEEAVEAGLADRVAEPSADDDVQPSNRFDQSIFNFAGRREAPGPRYPADHPDDGPAPTQGGSAVAFSDEQLTDLRQKLDVDADADEDTILGAVDALIEQATAPPPAPGPDEPPALPDGVVAVDAAQLEQLRNDAQAGREARTDQLAAQREQLVTAAVNDGRIPPARHQHWLDQLEADPGAEQTLAALKPGLVPVDIIGSGGTVDLDSDDAIYAELFGPTKEVAR